MQIQISLSFLVNVRAHEITKYKNLVLHLLNIQHCQIKYGVRRNWDEYKYCVAMLKWPTVCPNFTLRFRDHIKFESCYVAVIISQKINFCSKIEIYIFFGQLQEQPTVEGETTRGLGQMVFIIGANNVNGKYWYKICQCCFPLAYSTDSQSVMQVETTGILKKKYQKLSIFLIVFKALASLLLLSMQ